jgi:exosortase C (VPDSG-CTERM-specific)
MQEPSLIDQPPRPRAGASEQLASASENDRARLRRRASCFVVFLAGLTACFAKPLVNLFQLSLNSELNSHLFLMPVVSLYLVWLDKRKLAPIFEPAPRLTALLLLSGIGLVSAGWVASLSGWQPQGNDFLSLTTLAFLFCFAGGFALFFGGRILRSLTFPMAFLIFMVPLPVVLENGIVNFLQQSSAEASYLLLKLSGMPVFREGTRFTLPGVSIGVAPECSGIRSSLVLFITGILAAYFFLRQRWSRITLVAALIPLGILRNAVRIFTLAQLAVHVDPDILNSRLHHQGGPVFFAVSLAPFFFLIWFLRKCEARQQKHSACPDVAA